MWSHERHQKIIETLDASGKVQTAELAEILNVSRETIRRDLLDLEEAGALQRVHGGAIPVAQGILPEPSFSQRVTDHTEYKQAIGKVAAGLIESGSTIFVDAGSTTLIFARELIKTRNDVRIITNSIAIAQLAGLHSQLDTLLLGGVPHPEVPATYGELTLSEIERFRADYAIISPVALNMTRGATNYALHEAEVARKMIQSSKSSMVLCHAEKLQTESRVSICRPEEIDCLITDTRADPELTLVRGKVYFAAVS